MPKPIISIVPGTPNSVFVDRRRWKFDEDGFAQANNAALLQAQQQMQEKIVSLHSDIANTMHPSDFDVTVGGVAIDKASIEEI